MKGHLDVVGVEQNVLNVLYGDRVDQFGGRKHFLNLCVIGAGMLGGGGGRNGNMGPTNLIYFGSRKAIITAFS